MAKRRKSSGNRLIKSKVDSFDGTIYKSRLESYMAKLLTDAKIPFRYEEESFVVLEPFFFDKSSYQRQSNNKGEFKDRGNKKIQGMVYTPDFVGDGFIIETKGYSTAEFTMRFKLFKDYMVKNNLNYTIYVPQNIKECDETIKLIINNIKSK